MKHVKMLGLATAALALTAIIVACSASATVLCSTAADPCPVGQNWPVGTALDLSATKDIVMVGTNGEELDKCSTSTIKGKLTNAGNSTSTLTASIEELTWGSCTFPTKTLTMGALEIHKIAGTSNGTVTADGAFEWTTNTVFFGSCLYGFTAGKDIGTITEGNPAAITINTVVEKFSGSNFACPETLKMAGTYTLTSPAGTTLSVSDS